MHTVTVGMTNKRKRHNDVYLDGVLGLNEIVHRRFLKQGRVIVRVTAAVARLQTLPDENEEINMGT